MRNTDYINLDATDDDIEMLPNGFLSIMALLTRTGIFRYQQIDPDGTVRIISQLRTAENVFDPETMASLSGLPITNNHPENLLTPENASAFIVGSASTTPKRVFAPVQGDSEEYVQQRLTIWDEDVIELIKNKEKTQLSLGYSCELDFTAGVYKGENYDAIQKNIRVNHASLVQRGRAGPSCRVLMDDGTEQVVNCDGITDLEISNERKEPVVKNFTFDGKSFEVEDSVHALLTSFVGKLGEGENLAGSKQKEIDKVTAICDDLKSQLNVQVDTADASKFKEAVKIRVALEAQGASVLGESVNLDSLSDREIKEKCIVELRPACNLDGKSDAYVDARFDVAVEDHGNTSGDEGLGKKINNQDSSNDAWAVSAKAKKTAWEKATNAWKGGK